MPTTKSTRNHQNDMTHKAGTIIETIEFVYLDSLVNYDNEGLVEIKRIS